MNPLRLACTFAAAVLLACGAQAQAPATRPPVPANVAPPPMPANVAPPPMPPAEAPAAPADPAAQPGAAPQPIDEYRGGTEEEPQVTIIRREAETVEEFRVGGTLRYVRVTPRRGLPYYLIPNGNGQNFTRQDSLGSGLSVPMWLLFSW